MSDPTRALAERFTWMREHGLEIGDALFGHGWPLIAAASYVQLLELVDSMAH